MHAVKLPWKRGDSTILVVKVVEEGSLPLDGEVWCPPLGH